MRRPARRRGARWLWPPAPLVVDSMRISGYFHPTMGDRRFPFPFVLASLIPVALLPPSISGEIDLTGLDTLDRQLDRYTHSHVDAGNTMRLLVDGTMAFVGSYNFDQRSIAWNVEAGALFTDPEPVGRIQRMVDADLAQAFIVPVNQAWIDAQGPEETSYWDFSHSFNWLF
jgi:hypothetical protein